MPIDPAAHAFTLQGRFKWTTHAEVKAAKKQEGKLKAQAKRKAERDAKREAKAKGKAAITVLDEGLSFRPLKAPKATV